MSTDGIFVFFDLGNVLLSFDHRRACRQIAELAGCTADEVWHVVFGSDLEWRYERGEINTHEFFREVTRELNCRPHTADWESAASDIFAPQQGVYDIVAELRARQVPLGLFSNTNAVHWEFVCRKFEWLRDFFDAYALSFELRAMKPEPLAYARADEVAANCNGRTLFIDDRAENVAAAQHAGWDAFQFRDAASLRQELTQRRLLDLSTNDGTP